MKNQPYFLFIDDIRNLDDVKLLPRRNNENWIVARNSLQAIELIKQKNLPVMFSFDHDLGGNDTCMVFLRQLEAWMLETYPDKLPSCPNFMVHSANPVGKLNIISFMNSWRKMIEP